jgi:nucleoid-associated protein YgaU
MTPRDFSASSFSTPGHATSSLSEETAEPASGSASSVVHYVKSGESLWEIAQKYYNNGDKWSLIAKANPKVVQPNGAVREGVRLVIPKDNSRPTTTTESTQSVEMAGDITTSVASPRETGGSANTIKVESGDTLSDISLKYLGSSARWREIFDANRDKLKNSDDLKVGMTLRLPSGGSNSAAPAASERSSHSSQASSGQTARSGGTSYYAVQSNDTLSSIAKKTLGSPNAWKKIFDANRDQLDSADDLRVGQKLKIPAP